MQLTAKQLPSWQILRPSHCINERHLNGTFGEVVATAAFIHAKQNRFKTTCFLVENCWRQIRLDCMQDALGGLFIPRRTTNGGRLAPPHCTVGQLDPNDAITLLLY